MFYRLRAHCASWKPGTAALSVSAKCVHLNEDKIMLDSFRNDDIGQVCREDKTIRQVGRLLWQKDRTKVDKSDEVRKTVDDLNADPCESLHRDEMALDSRH